MRVLPDKPEDITLASYVRKMATVFLLDEYANSHNLGDMWKSVN